MRSRAGNGSTTASMRERASLASCLRRAGLMPCVAGCTGTSPSVWTGASPLPISSCSVTQNWFRWRSLPCSSTIAPAPSWRATHGWLNHTATSGPVSSNTRASTRF